MQGRPNFAATYDALHTLMCERSSHEYLLVGCSNSLDQMTEWRVRINNLQLQYGDHILQPPPALDPALAEHAMEEMSGLVGKARQGDVSSVGCTLNEIYKMVVNQRRDELLPDELVLQLLEREVVLTKARMFDLEVQIKSVQAETRRHPHQIGRVRLALCSLHAAGNSQCSSPLSV